MLLILIDVTYKCRPTSDANIKITMPVFIYCYRTANRVDKIFVSEFTRLTALGNSSGLTVRNLGGELFVQLKVPLDGYG